MNDNLENNRPAEEQSFSADTPPVEQNGLTESAAANEAPSVKQGDSAEAASTHADIPSAEQDVSNEALPTEQASSNEAAPEQNAKKPDSARAFIQSAYDYIDVFCYAVALMIVLFMFVFRYVTVVGESMVDTLHDDDKLIISNLCYTPERGDIVVLKFHPDPLIKRVIGLGGDKVKINFDTWQIWVNGELLSEDYITADDVRPLHKGSFTEKYMLQDENACEFTVDEGKIFFLGDNRNNSSDSRVYGFFEVREIIGRVILRVFPQFGPVQ